MKFKLPRPKLETVMRFSCVLALIGLALMLWSIFDPSPAPIMIAMSVGQGFGTLSFLLFLGCVIADLRRARVIGAKALPAREEWDGHSTDGSGKRAGSEPKAPTEPKEPKEPEKKQEGAS